MLKNVICIVLFAICMYISVFSLKFNVKNGTYTFCDKFASNGRLEQTERDTASIIKLKGGYKAETVCFDSSDETVIFFLEKYEARYIKRESYEFGESYYYYSPKIPFYELIDGFMVNIQVAKETDKTYIGTPIIYGGF